MFELIFLGIFIFIIVLIIYSTVKEKDFSQKVYTSLQSRFPSLELAVLSEGGFFSNPHIRGITNNKEESLKNLDLRVKVYHSGKHRHEDLILTAELIIPEIQHTGFSTVIKREGFFKRIFGGENVQVGNKSIDDRLFIKASDPFKAKLFFFDNNFLISSSIAQISDLKECKITIEGNIVDLYVRSDKVSSWYVESLFDLVQTLSNSKPYRHRFGRLNPQKVMSSIGSRISPPLKQQKFQSEQPIGGSSEILSRDLTQEIRDELKEFQFNASDFKLHENSATLSFYSGFFKEISLNWTTREITLHTQRETKLSEDFRIFMTSSQSEREDFDWNDPFKGISIDITPKEFSEEFLRKHEIGRHFNELLGALPPQVTLEYTPNLCQVTINASAIPENIQPMIDLIQALGWFIELSFVTYF